jgi:hypothetical protein
MCFPSRVVRLPGRVLDHINYVKDVVSQVLRISIMVVFIESVKECKPSIQLAYVSYVSLKQHPTLEK